MMSFNMRPERRIGCFCREFKFNIGFPLVWLRFLDFPEHIHFKPAGKEPKIRRQIPALLTDNFIRKPFKEMSNVIRRPSAYGEKWRVIDARNLIRGGIWNIRSIWLAFIRISSENKFFVAF